MTQKIKFRVWDTEREALSEPFTLTAKWIRFGNTSSEITWLHDEYRMDVMRYINVLDKNGVEIYEGDVLRLLFGTITMDGYVKPKDDGEWIVYKDEGNFLGVYHNREHVTVIGNIYENPELLIK